EPDRHIATLRSYRVHFSHLPRVGTGARAPVGVGWPGRGRVARARPRPPVCRVSPGVPGRSRCAGSVAACRVSPGQPRGAGSVAGPGVQQSEPSEPGERREGDGRGEGGRGGTGAGEVPAHGVVAARTTVARGTVTGAGGRGGAVIVGVAKGRGPVVVPWSRGAVAVTIAVPRSRGAIAVAIAVAGGRGFVVIRGRGGVVFIAVVLSPVGGVLVGGLAVLGRLAGLPGERGHVEGDRGAGVRGGRDGQRHLGVL